MKKAMHAKPFRLHAPGHKARHARPESPRTRVVRAVSLCLACICLLVTATVYPASAATGSSSMSSLQNKLNKLSQSIKLHEQELNDAKKKEAAAKALESELKERVSVIQDQISVLSGQIASVQNSIGQKEQEISAKETEIAEKETEIEEKELEIQDQWSDFKKHMAAMQELRDGGSVAMLSAVNDLSAAFTKTVKLLRTDTSEMSEEELAAHNQKLNKAVLKDIQCGLELYGVPAANIRKVMQAFEGYWEDAQAIGRGEGFSFNSAPSSATGQYDRLYNAIQSGDSEEAAAAMKKLEQMNKTDKVDGELARRLKQYDADVLAAAEARNAGKTRAEEKARKAVFEKLREGLDVAPVTDRAKGKADAARRAQLIDLVNKAVDGKADELLAGGKDGSIYDALLDEVKNGRVEDAQEELDRLMTAGKDKGSIKSKITESVKEEYLAGSDRDREKLEKKLLALEDAEGKPLYEEKNFAQWVSAADKKAEKAKDEKNWWEGVK